MKIKVADVVVGDRMRKDFGDLEDLAASMTRLGQLQPIIVDHEHKLIAGERRYRAAQLNRWDEIDAIYIDECDELKRKEVELEENLKRKDFTWPEEVLALRDIFELKRSIYGARRQGSKDGGFGVKDASEAFDRSLGSISFDLSLASALAEFPALAEEKTKSAAFKRYKRLREQAIRTEQARRTSANDIVNASSRAALPPSRDQGASPEQRPSPTGEAGEKTEILRATFAGVGAIYRGDSRVVLKKLPNAFFDCIVTDPPYALSMFGEEGSTTSGKRLAENQGGMYDDDPHKVIEMLDKVFAECARVLKPDGHAYFFYHHNWHTEMVRMLSHHFGDSAVDDTPIIWVKNTPGIGDPNERWVYAYEPCLFVNRGRSLVKAQPFNYLQVPTVPPAQKIHPTEKPMMLLRRLIEASCVPGEMILDCFAGSGSTLIAAVDLGMRFVGIEMSDVYYQKIRDRLAETIGEKADGNGSTTGGE